MTQPKHRRTSSLLGIRTVIGPLTKRVPAVHRALVAAYHFALLEVRPRVVRVVSGTRAAAGSDTDLAAFLSLQREVTMPIRIAAPASPQQLAESLRAAGCTVMEGGWTLYVPPSAALHAAVPEMQMYPPHTGLKILKDLRPPSQALYAAHHLRPTPGAAGVRARTPAPRELLRVAAALHAAGLAPRTYDLLELRPENAAAGLTAFACQHVGGASPTPAEHARFIERLKRVLQQGAIDVLHGTAAFSSDFAAPDCSGNLVRPEGGGEPMFVDAQAFCFHDERRGFENWAQQHSGALGFGGARIGRGDRYLYQAVPGLGPAKRGTLDRWARLDALLQLGGVSVQDRVSFDIGCNSGLMSYYALARGARWAFGWDRPATAAAAAQLIPLLGGSRFTATGADINPSTPFIDAVPAALRRDRRGVLFFLSVSDHIGFPPGVAELPWDVCVYEGHNGQDVATARDMVNKSGWASAWQELASDMWQDGDSPARPVVLMRRK